VEEGFELGPDRELEGAAELTEWPLEREALGDDEMCCLLAGLPASSSVSSSSSPPSASSLNRFCRCNRSFSNWARSERNEDDELDT
jgi:hypothetical protein